MGLWKFKHIALQRKFGADDKIAAWSFGAAWSSNCSLSETSNYWNKTKKQRSLRENNYKNNHTKQQIITGWVIFGLKPNEYSVRYHRCQLKCDTIWFSAMFLATILGKDLLYSTSDLYLHLLLLLKVICLGVDYTLIKCL